MTPEPPGPPGRLLGIDLGTRRIGVAVSDRDQRLATAATVLERRGDAADSDSLATLVADYEAVGVVVGLPLSLDGELGPAARAALEEIDRLRDALGVPIGVIDERFTTVSAIAALRRGGHRPRARRQVVDQAAAALLLQSWLDRRASTRDGAS